MGESAQGESALKIELGVLRQRLSEKEAQVVSGEERLSRLEAVHRVAQVCFLTVLESCAGDASVPKSWTHMQLGAAHATQGQHSHVQLHPS